LPGQNRPTPAQKVFDWHCLIKRVKSEDPLVVEYYDPAYGLTADDEEAYTDSTIEGWGLTFYDDNLRFKKRASGEHVKFFSRE
jgi:hypothetical protein